MPLWSATLPWDALDLSGYEVRTFLFSLVATDVVGGVMTPEEDGGCFDLKTCDPDTLQVIVNRYQSVHVGTGGFWPSVLVG